MKLLLYGGGLITYRKILKRILNLYFHQKKVIHTLNHTFKGKTLYSSHNWQHCNVCSEAVAGI